MKTKFALVLSGGGFNGAFQVGALRYINQNWKAITGLDSAMKFDIISGVSAGTLNGALLAQNQFHLLENLWVDEIGKVGSSAVYTSDFIDTQSKEDKLKFKLDLNSLIKKLKINLSLNLSLFQKIGLAFSQKKRTEIFDQIISNIERDIKSNIKSFRSIADNSPLVEKLSKYLNRQLIKETIFTCGFVSLNTGEYNSVKHTEFVENTDFLKGVIASTSIPAIWSPVDQVSFYRNNNIVTSYNNIDGGVINVSPFGDVIKLIEEDQEVCQYKIIAINCHSGFARFEDYTDKSLGQIIARSIYQLTFNEIFNNDINYFTKLNELVQQIQVANPRIVIKNAKNKTLKAFDATIINPSPSIDLGNPLVANESLINLRIQHGFEQAQKMFLKP